MGKIVRYEFIGNRGALALQVLLQSLIAIQFPLLLVVFVPCSIVYLLLTVVRIEEVMENPNEFIAGFIEGRFRK